MRVLIVSWEYPPVLVGGLGRHVHALATELACAGHDVVVLTRHPTGTDAVTHPTAVERLDGVRVLRVAEDPLHLVFERDLFAWALAHNQAAVRAASTRLAGWVPEVVHAHDWLAGPAAIGLAELFAVPLVATMHATEAGRWAGWLVHPLSRQVHSAEWWLARRADSVITCSAAMRGEVAALFGVDPAGITVLPNGIAAERWRVGAERVAAARRAHAPDGQPLLVHFGRLEHAKGGHDLVAALPRIRSRFPGTRLAVAGTGAELDTLIAAARRHRVRRAVAFVGHLPDPELGALVAAADAVVLPSRYEPFGIVALEAAAVGAPLVTSTAGGLGEVVRDGETGLSFPPGDVPALAGAVTAVLADPQAAARRARAARARLATAFDWTRIAAATAQVYTAARRRDPVELGRPDIPAGNIFRRPAAYGTATPSDQAASPVNTPWCSMSRSGTSSTGPSSSTGSS